MPVTSLLPRCSRKYNIAKGELSNISLTPPTPTVSFLSFVMRVVKPRSQCRFAIFLAVQRAAPYTGQSWERPRHDEYRSMIYVKKMIQGHGGTYVHIQSKKPSELSKHSIHDHDRGSFPVFEVGVYETGGFFWIN